LDNLRKEIVRRGTFLDKPPRPKAWKKTECIHWLLGNCANGDDLTYAQEMIHAYIHKYKDSIKRLDDSLNLNEIKLYRLYEAFFLEEHMDAFYKRNDSMNRAQLDARNSEQMPLSYYEMVSVKYNTEDWVPMSRTYPDFHYYYRNSYPLPLGDDPITPEFAKRQMNKAREALLVVSTF